MSIGSKIRERRKATKKTQQQIADAMGVDRVSVTNWESNKTKPDVKRISDLAAFLGVSADYFFSDGSESLETIDNLLSERAVFNAIVYCLEQGFSSRTTPSMKAEIILDRARFIQETE